MMRASILSWQFINHIGGLTLRSPKDMIPMSYRSLFFTLGFGLVCAAIFLIYPAIDLRVSQEFFNGVNFTLGTSNSAETIREAISLALGVWIAVLALQLSVKLIRPQWRSWIRTKSAIFILLCFLFAPALMVNLVFKDHWGRPRPSDIYTFNGDKVFQPAWIYSNECDSNCSFVSGEASEGFIFFALIPLVRRKKLAASFAIITGALIGLLRIAQGGHFLSDIIFSGVVCYVTIWCVYWVLYESTLFRNNKGSRFFVVKSNK